MLQARPTDSAGSRRPSNIIYRRQTFSTSNFDGNNGLKLPACASKPARSALRDPLTRFSFKEFAADCDSAQFGLLETAMRFLILALAFSAPTWSNCQAAGSFQKPAAPTVVTAGISPTIRAPDISERDLVGGCGRGRTRDPQTHGCRGPADIR